MSVSRPPAVPPNFHQLAILTSELSSTNTTPPVETPTGGDFGSDASIGEDSGVVAFDATEGVVGNGGRVVGSCAARTSGSAAGRPKSITLDAGDDPVPVRPDWYVADDSAELAPPATNQPLSRMQRRYASSAALSSRHAVSSAAIVVGDAPRLNVTEVQPEPRASTTATMAAYRRWRRTFRLMSSVIT